MSKLAGKNGQHVRGNSPAVPVKPITTERTVVTNMCAAEDRSDCGQDELSEQIANSRSRVSLRLHISTLIRFRIVLRSRHKGAENNGLIT
jgi:hypothetical protein